MAEPHADQNREIVDALRKIFAEAVMRLPAGIEPAPIYSLSPPSEDAEQDVESL
jgi:hypothetical protein